MKWNLDDSLPIGDVSTQYMLPGVSIVTKMDAQPNNAAPHGMEPYDLPRDGELGALSREQQEKLNNFKIKTRLENEQYLRKHPEIECMLTGFLNQVLINRPENIREFAAEHFTDKNLPNKIQQQLEDRQVQLKTHTVLKKMPQKT